MQALNIAVDPFALIDVRSVASIKEEINQLFLDGGAFNVEGAEPSLVGDAVVVARGAEHNVRVSGRGQFIWNRNIQTVNRSLMSPKCIFLTYRFHHLWLERSFNVIVHFNSPEIDVIHTEVGAHLERVVFVDHNLQ